MESNSLFGIICPVIVGLVFITSCIGQEKSKLSRETPATTQTPYVLQRYDDSPIADYIRDIYQDKEGNLWFGTNGFGVARYDGDSISYFSIDEGFNGYQITGISEDVAGDLWFSTDQGVVRYNSGDQDDTKNRFINFSDVELFDGQRFWSILADSDGNIWAGAERGIYHYDGQSWSSFALPYPDQITGEFITSATSWSIIENSKGDIWFSTNG